MLLQLTFVSIVTCIVMLIQHKQHSDAEWLRFYQYIGYIVILSWGIVCPENVNVCVCTLQIRKLPSYCGGRCYFLTVKIISRSCPIPSTMYFINSAKSFCPIQLLDVTSIISSLKLICPKKWQLWLTCQSGVLDITVWKKWHKVNKSCNCRV